MKDVNISPAESAMRLVTSGATIALRRFRARPGGLHQRCAAALAVGVAAAASCWPGGLVVMPRLTT